MVRGLFLLFCASLWLTFSSARGQGNDSLSFYTLTIKDLDANRVLAASKLRQSRREAPGVIDLYERKDLNTYGFISFNELLYSSAGFAPSQDFDRRTVSSRGVFEGWNNNHLLILMDGVPFNDNLYGSAYTWEIMPLVFTQAVEVVRGPGSSLYGSNAVNGLLSISTMSPKDLGGKHGMAQVRIGNNGRQIYDLLLGFETPLIDITLAGNYFRTDGNEYLSFDDYIPTSPDGTSLAEPTPRMTNDNRQSGYGFLKLEGKNKLSGWELQYHEQHWDFETGHGWLFQIPDREETMRENRRILTLKYSTDYLNKALVQEYTFRYQRRGIDWDMRYFPDQTTAFGIYYPNGADEYLKTTASDLLFRAQWTFRFFEKSAILGGVEGNIFSYNGDKEHFANLDLTSTFEPFPNNEQRPMGPWFEYIDGRRVNNAAAFLQYVSPKFQEKIQFTASARFDAQFFSFDDLTATDSLGNTPVRQKEFTQLSPRLAVVYTPSEKLTFKALAGRAFRTPSPTEMFGANTFTLASNINELSPESMTTVELQSIWQPNRFWTLDAVAFYNLNFEGIIAYSEANANLSTNLYDLSTWGVELSSRYENEHFSTFLNYTYTHRTDERIVDENIAESDGTLTWYPAHVANLGLSYERKPGFLSLLLHYQGEVKRRSSDLGLSSMDFRPPAVENWLSLNTKLALTPLPDLEVGLLVINVLDTEQFLIKNNAYRFDYRQERRQWLASVAYRF